MDSVVHDAHISKIDKDMEYKVYLTVSWQYSLQFQQTVYEHFSCPSRSIPLS